MQTPLRNEIEQGVELKVTMPKIDTPLREEKLKRVSI